MPNIVPAAAQGLPEVNRRRLLGGIAGLTAASAVAGASAATAATYEPLPHEPAVVRVHKLADELSLAMDEWMDDISHPDHERQLWQAHVYPQSHAAYPVMFEDVRSRRVKAPREQAIWHMRELERLALEDGGSDIVVQVIASYDCPQGYKLLGVHFTGRLMDHDGMFAAKGGAL